ncbi:TonB-dependent receptor [Methanococcoides sp. SA1]|nr:TonB-dependent receptor [Methanococcoides sp. SA1]
MGCKKLMIVILGIFLFSTLLFAQTTGKVSGRIFDKATGEPIYGANIIIEALGIGSASDQNGEFYIINIKPGTYDVAISMIGYNKYIVSDLRVSVNRTASFVAELTTKVIEGQTVIVEAQKIRTKKDQTSSVSNISADEISKLAVEDIAAVVNLQAGVVDGHFRGGRANEVSFMIDGVQVVEPFDGENNLINIETDVIDEIEVINGTFNAEYGRAMSGVVNAVTKSGGKDFHGSFSSNFANFLTANDDIFIGLDKSEFDRQKDLKFQLSGPIWGEKITFLTNFRMQDKKGYLNSIHRFNVDDYSDFSTSDPDYWYSEHSGDSSYVASSFSKLNSFMGKISANFIKAMRMSLMYTLNDEEWRDYDHYFKYNPNGKSSNFKRADMFNFSLNHMISNSLFYDLSVSYIDNYYGNYRYKNPLSDKYVHGSYLNSNGPSFYTGGQEKDHTERTVNDFNFKYDITWQANNRHLFKSGILYTQHEIDHAWHEIENDYRNRPENENATYYDWDTEKVVFPYYEPVIYPDSTVYADVYNVKPKEFSAFIQDKMEFNQMVVNLGVRYDYYDPNTTFPSERRNPANQLTFINNPEKMSEPKDTKPQFQISPRLGLSYQLGETAVLHFSYGHFFQMPPMYALFQNHSLRVSPTDYSTTMGNSQLKAQQTIQYEIGLWQELTKGMGLEIVVFYRDIYDLLSTKIISTFNQIEYGLYTNKDYGNVKGLELKYDFRYGNFSTNINYTLQYTRGNADNPTQTFNRAGDSKDPIAKLIPMSWDQRHTFNITAGYNTEKYGATVTAYYNSGTPFTWSPLSEYRVANINLLPNNAYVNSNYSVDLNGYVKLYSKNDFSVQLNYRVYNLLDRLNEYWVNSQTGRAYTAIIQPSDLSAHHSNFNEYIDTIHNPSMYSEPRLIKVGLGLKF